MLHRPTVLLTLVGVQFLGCSLTTTGLPDDRFPIDASIDTASANDSAPITLPGRVFHLPGPVDAVSLGLWDDGTFRWDIDGCDFRGEGCGTWHLVGTTIVLTPSPGSTTFPWVAGAGFRNPADHVDLVVGNTGLTAEVFLHDGTRVSQTWPDGRVCPVCAGLGPSAVVACDARLMARCTYR